jgi:ankyrin repeat protein
LRAIVERQEGVVEELLKKSIDLEFKDEEYSQMPLSYAIENGHKAIVKLLFEKGAKLESKDITFDRTLLL